MYYKYGWSIRAQGPQGGVHKLEPLFEVLHKHGCLNYRKIFSLIWHVVTVVLILFNHVYPGYLRDLSIHTNLMKVSGISFVELKTEK